MSTTPRPEAIRGAWYRVDPETDDAGAGQLPDCLMTFDIEGTFRRYDLDDGSGTLADEGGYTFDGDFLILRGGRTRTYRVQLKAPWIWRLEGKKGEWDLRRGLYGGDREKRLSSARREELGRMPQRVLCRRDLEDTDIPSPHSLVDPSETEGDVAIGSLFATDADDRRLWVVVTPYVADFGVEFWQRLVRGSFLSDHHPDASDLEAVDVRVAGEDVERRLSV
jgi:hypothetical protein